MKQGARESVQSGWYEAGLSLGERKRRGHFSTPLALVDQMLDACGYNASADLCQLRVLDPACGSGNFLMGAARRLCLCGLAQGLDKTHIAALVQHNIWGLDPDPVACFLAEMQVCATIDATCQTHPTSDQPRMQRNAVSDASCQFIPSSGKPPIQRNTTGDALYQFPHASDQPGMQDDATRKTRAKTHKPPLHIHQADSLALPWQPCADLLLANPPYLAAKNTDLSHYHQARQRGQADSYLLFLDLALRTVRPGGWIGLVLPDPVLARANAASERARLLSAWTLHHLWHLSGVFAAEVGATILIAQNIPPRSLHQVIWTRARWHAKHPPQPTSGQLSQTVSQELLASQPRAELRYLLNSEQGRVSERLRCALEVPSTPSHLLPLEALVDMKRGEELGREHSALKPLAELVDGHPVLRGGVDLRPYAQPQASWGIKREAVKKPIERYLQPKLLIVKSSDHLQAALDTRGHVVLQTLYVLRVREHIESEMRRRRAPSLHSRGREASSLLDIAYFLLALLNSRLLRAYVMHLHTAYKLVHPQIEQGVLARLPVAWGESAARQEISERARELERACSEAEPVVEWGQHLTFLYEEQERAVRALYAAAVPGIFDDKGVIIYG